MPTPKFALNVLNKRINSRGTAYALKKRLLNFINIYRNQSESKLGRVDKSVLLIHLLHYW